MSEVGVFQWEGDFGFCLFSGDSEFCHHCEFGNEQRVWKESFAVTSKDSIDLVIVQGVLEVLVLHVVVEVVIELGVVDSVYVDMVVGMEKGFPEKGIMSLGVYSMGGVKIFQLVTCFGNGQGFFDPVDGGVSGTEPGESKNDVFLSTAHNIEEVSLSDPFNVHVEGAGVADCTSFVHSLVDVVNGDGGGEFFSRESVFPDKLPVNARDVSAGVYQRRGVDDFEGMRGGDQLNRDMHRFIQS